MKTTFSDACSRNTAKNSGQQKFQDELYPKVYWGTLSSEEESEKQEINAAATEEIPIEEITKEEVVQNFKEFAEKQIDESPLKKISTLMAEVLPKKKENLGHSLSSSMSKSDLLGKLEAEVPVEHFKMRMEKLTNKDKVKVLFVTKQFCMQTDSSDLVYADLDTVFENEAANLFDRMVQAMKLSSDDFFVSAVNLDEDTERTETLLEEIVSFAPQLIITLGAVASNALLNKKERLARTHGQIQTIKVNQKSQEHVFQVMPLFHPEYLLINPKMKKLAWEDMQKAMVILN